MTTVRIEPRCMLQGKERRQQAAVTNRGHLIPCCWVDQPKELEHPVMKEMLKVSKISEVKSIDEILLSEPWQKFAKDLAERNMKEIMPVCIKHCKKWSGGKDQQKVEELHRGGKTYKIANPNENNGDDHIDITKKTYTVVEK